MILRNNSIEGLESLSLNPTVPTPTTDTQVANKEFVNAEIANDAVAKVASTDNAIVRFNGATGEVQNSSVLVTDTGNLLVGTTTDNGVDKLRVNGSIGAYGTNSKEFTISKVSSGGIFDFTSNELFGGESSDNNGYLIFLTVHRPTSDISNDAASMLVMGIKPRGGNSTFTTISILKGGGISTLTASLLNSNDLRITTDSGVTFRCILKVIAMGGMN